MHIYFCYFKIKIHRQIIAEERYFFNNHEKYDSVVIFGAKGVELRVNFIKFQRIMIIQTVAKIIDAVHELDRID